MSASSRVRPLVLGCLVFHLAAITVANLPVDGAVGKSLHAPFNHYLAGLGLWQRWNMFTTVPYFHHLDAVANARFTDGKTQHFGPLLPELSAYPDANRLHGFFLRTAFPKPQYEAYAKTYGRRLCRAIAARAGRSPESVEVIILADRLRRLAEVRKDNVLGKRERVRMAVTRCEEGTP